MFGWGEKRRICKSGWGEKRRRCKFGGKWVIYVILLGRKNEEEVN
jgi:hypothetical protein